MNAKWKFWNTQVNYLALSLVETAIEKFFISSTIISIPELDYSNLDKSPEKLCFAEPINFEAAYGSVTASVEKTNDSGILTTIP